MLLANRLKAVVVPGLVALVASGVVVPVPVPSGFVPPSAAFCVRSTVAEAMADSVSDVVAEMLGLNTEVAVFAMLNGAPALVALGGSVALTMTL